MPKIEPTVNGHHTAETPRPTRRARNLPAVPALNTLDSGEALSEDDAAGAIKIITVINPAAPASKTAAAARNKIITVITPTLGEAALHGKIGEFIRGCEPYTEATRAAMLAHLLPALGMLAGPKPYVYLGQPQPPRINVVLVGPSGTGRKGTASYPVDTLCEKAAPVFWKAQRATGISSGEGLIVKVQDSDEAEKKPGKQGAKDDEPDKPTEKRLLVAEQELSRVFANIRREGNVASQVIREAFDSGGNLATLTVIPRQATGVHISIVGHITQDELLSRLNEVEMANGFGNRFLWFNIQSEKVLSLPDPIPDSVYETLLPRVKDLYQLGTLALATDCDLPVELEADAREVWHELYCRLRPDQPGLAGAMLSRSYVFVGRMALIYALTEKWTKHNKVTIGKEHLEAALAVWDYCEESAFQLFNGCGRASDSLAEKLLELIAERPRTKNDLNSHLSLGQKSLCGDLLASLCAAGQIVQVEVKADGPGRPAKMYKLVTPQT